MTKEQAKSHPGVLAGTHYAWRNRAHAHTGGWVTLSKAAKARYDLSDKGRESARNAQLRYNMTPAGIKRSIRAAALRRGNK